LIYPNYEEVKKYKQKYLLIIIKDMRSKKTRKWFKFENYPKIANADNRSG